MKRPCTWRALRAALPVLLILNAGCGGSASPHYYVLAPVGSPAPAGPPATTSPVTIGVGPVRMPAYVDRPQIVTRKSSDEISLAEFDRWGEPLGEGVPRIIAQNLARLLPNDRVALLPWAGVRAPQYQVVVDIARFDGTVGGSAMLEARWRVIGGDGKAPREGHFAMSEPASEPGYRGLVAAMSRGLGSLSREIAGAIGSP